MIAASFWSLLAPSISMAEEMGMVKWVPPLIGFLLGGVFLRLADRLLPLVKEAPRALPFRIDLYARRRRQKRARRQEHAELAVHLDELLGGPARGLPDPFDHERHEENEHEPCEEDEPQHERDDRR